MHAVITGDIVDSMSLNREQHTLLRSFIEEGLRPHQLEFFRGDSFQCYLEEPEEALRLSMLCRTIAISLIQEEHHGRTDLRLSIGLGSVEEPIEQLATAQGEAFLLSGRTLDSISKEGGNISIVVNHKFGSPVLQMMSDYINYIFEKMTARQAEVIKELLGGLNQQQVAEKLQRSKSTISQHVSAGGWEHLEKILNYYHTIVKQISNDE